MAFYIQGRRIKTTRILLVIVGLCALVYLLRNVSSSYHHAENVDEVSLDHHNDQNEVHHGKKSKTKNADILDEVSEAFLKRMDKKKCQNYVDYSQEKHPPYSSGKFHFPYMRPPPKCRTFKSPAVEKVVADLKRKIADPDLARLVENCLPNTLDTTILWHKPENEDKQIPPETFVVTGDIHAEWLRDSARQLSVYQPFVRYDPDLKHLIKGAISTQATYITNSPYCNAFHPPDGSHVKKGESAIDQVFPRPDWRHVFECKYELDSLASFLTLSNEYYENSGDDSFVDKRWLRAYEKLLVVLKRESLPTFDANTGRVLPFYYTFQRQTNIGSETLPLAGTGNPVNYGTGLVRSAFRPSDDACILQFFVPANMHMLSELQKIRNNLLSRLPEKLVSLVEITDEFIDNIRSGIQHYGIVDHPKHGKVYAYEVDGYGGNIFMDDANLPSLLSLPEMGVDKNDEVYQNTRKMILSKDGNPYFLTGYAFEGVGGPHIGINYAWPMSLLMRIRTSDDDGEIMTSLKYVMENTAGLGLMHESVHVNSRNGHDFTRSWFAWCNSEFGKTILHLAQHKPHLIFNQAYAVPYSIDDVLRTDEQ